MLGHQHVTDYRAARGHRWHISGVIRRGEYRSQYATNPQMADDVAAQWRRDGLRNVQVTAPEELTDVVLALKAAGAAWTQARRDERGHAQQAAALIVQADAAGIPKTVIADHLEVDRQTVYRALGLK